MYFAYSSIKYWINKIFNSNLIAEMTCAADLNSFL